MVSGRAKGWRWYDWIFFLIVLIVICTLIQLLAPGTGLARSLHAGFHAFSLFLDWIAGGLTSLATLMNSL